MPRTFTTVEKSPFQILANEGIAAIWKMYESAAAAHRMGLSRSAEAIMEIAEATEKLGSAVWPHV